MKCYRKNQPILDQVWDRLQRRLRGYPGVLGTLAAEFRTTLGRKPARYFSGPDAAPLLHLPLWLARPGTRRALPDLLEATALAYFFVRIQDNVLDEPVTRGRPPLLLLGNVFLADALAMTARFVNGEPFWQRARQAWQIFALETEAERRWLAQGRPYGWAAFRRHARKVALARIPMHAVLMREGRSDARTLALVDRLIDLMGQSYGLVNDVLGCHRDLMAGTRTFLLASAGATLRASARRDTAALRQAVLARPWFEQFLTRAIRVHRRALPVGVALGVREMAAFTEERVARIEWHLRRASVLRLAVALAPTRTAQ